MSLMSLINGRRDNTFHLSFKLAAKVCIFAHIAKIFVSFLLYFHHFSYLCTRNKKQPLKTGVHWTLRGTDHSECLQQTDNQPSNWKGSIPSSSTRKSPKKGSTHKGGLQIDVLLFCKSKTNTTIRKTKNYEENHHNYYASLRHGINIGAADGF